MIVRKFLTVRSIAYIIVPLLIVLLAFSNPWVCKAEEIENTSEIEHLGEVSEMQNELSTQIETNSELDTNQEQLEVAPSGIADIYTQLTEVVTLQTYITGILIFFVIVVLCKYTYKFFNMFF